MAIRRKKKIWSAAFTGPEAEIVAKELYRGAAYLSLGRKYQRAQELVGGE